MRENSNYSENVLPLASMTVIKKFYNQSRCEEIFWLGMGRAWFFLSSGRAQASYFGLGLFRAWKSY
jgi:hypothetical protein